MKSTNIFFWIVTILFAGFMLFVGYSEITLDPKGTGMMKQLGYPNYFTVFLGWTKILGAIALLVPVNVPRLKEWAYAGFFFDLVGAAYSQIAVGGLNPQVLFMVVFFIFLFLSYYLYHKRRSLILAKAR